MHHPPKLVFQNTHPLQQFRPPSQPIYHTFVLLLYNRKKSDGRRKYPTLTPLLPHRLPSSTAWRSHFQQPIIAPKNRHTLVQLSYNHPLGLLARNPHPLETRTHGTFWPCVSLVCVSPRCVGVLTERSAERNGLALPGNKARASLPCWPPLTCPFPWRLTRGQSRVRVVVCLAAGDLAGANQRWL